MVLEQLQKWDAEIVGDTATIDDEYHFFVEDLRGIFEQQQPVVSESKQNEMLANISMAALGLGKELRFFFFFQPLCMCLANHAVSSTCICDSEDLVNSRAENVLLVKEIVYEDDQENNDWLYNEDWTYKDKS